MIQLSTLYSDPERHNAQRAVYDQLKCYENKKIKTKPLGARFKLGYQKSTVESKPVIFEPGVKIMDGKLKIIMIK